MLLFLLHLTLFRSISELTPGPFVIHQTIKFMKSETLMFKPLDAPENVWAMKISGDVSVEDVHAMYAELDTMLKTNRTIGVVMDIGNFNDASPGAISADVKHELSLLGNITQFKRMALLTDKKWISYLVERLDPVIPTMKMKIFPLGSSEAAINWAASE